MIKIVENQGTSLKPETSYEPGRWSLYVDLSIWLNQFALHLYCLIGIVMCLREAFKIRIQRSRIAVIDFSVCVYAVRTNTRLSSKYSFAKMNLESTWVVWQEMDGRMCRFFIQFEMHAQQCKDEILLEKWTYWNYGDGDTLLIWLVGITILFVPFRQTETIYCNLHSVIRLVLISTEQNLWCAVNRFNAQTQ